MTKCKNENNYKHNIKRLNLGIINRITERIVPLNKRNLNNSVYIKRQISTNKNISKIPIIENYKKINFENLDLLTSQGVAYVKIPSYLNIKTPLKNIMNQGQCFFTEKKH